MKKLGVLMSSTTPAIATATIELQKTQQPDAFRRYEFGSSKRSVIPSLVYIRPDDLEHVRMIVGPDAELGAEVMRLQNYFRALVVDLLD